MCNHDLRITLCSQLTAHCSLVTANYSLLTTHYLPAEALEKIRQGCTELNLSGACSGAPPRPRGTASPRHACRGDVRRATPSEMPHALATPTARAPRVPQAMRSATRGPRSWPPRSRPTRPSPRWSLMVRAAAPLPTPAAPPHTRTRAGGGVRRAAPSALPHALAAPTARAIRVPQAIRLATRGPRSWPPRSRTTRPSPCWTSEVRAAAPLPTPAAPPHTRTRAGGACGAPPRAHCRTRSPRPPRVRPACRRE